MAMKRKRDAAGSLIERAAETYDFGMVNRYAAPLVGSEDKAAPAPVRYVPAPSLDPAKLAKVDRDLLRSNGFIIPGAPPTSLSEEFRLVKRQLQIGRASCRERVWR